MNFNSLVEHYFNCIFILQKTFCDKNGAQGVFKINFLLSVCVIDGSFLCIHHSLPWSSLGCYYGSSDWICREQEWSDQNWQTYSLVSVLVYVRLVFLRVEHFLNSVLDLSQFDQRLLMPTLLVLSI